MAQLPVGLAALELQRRSEMSRDFGAARGDTVSRVACRTHVACAMPMTDMNVRDIDHNKMVCTAEVRL